MTYLLPFAASAIVAFVVGAIVRRVAIERGVVVLPRPDRWHRHPTPPFGGIAIFLGLVAGLLLRIPDLSALAPLAVAGAGVALFGVGWYDDVRPMSALSKMVSSLAVAGFFVFTVFYQATPA